MIFSRVISRIFILLLINRIIFCSRFWIVIRNSKLLISLDLVSFNFFAIIIISFRFFSRIFILLLINRIIFYCRFWIVIRNSKLLISFHLVSFNFFSIIIIPIIGFIIGIQTFLIQLFILEKRINLF